MEPAVLGFKPISYTSGCAVHSRVHQPPTGADGENHTAVGRAFSNHSGRSRFSMRRLVAHVGMAVGICDLRITTNSCGQLRLANPEVAKPVGLLTAGTLHRLLVRKRINFNCSAVDDFG